MPADAGIRFGQYILVRRIARGGMAEVFLAQQRGLEGFDRRVAVKRILPHLADSPDFVKMFLGEARLAAQLAHPNIVHIYEFGKVEHDYFIAMEFVDGVHAGQLFKHGENDKLSPTLIARIGADAANALHYAHELRGPNGKTYGLVHRDVSPANIMVSFDGVVKLCDFGIAKAAAAGDQLTNPGQVKGKYAYMSPEQTIASQLDGRSDVFSLSIVLWELLTGKYIVPRGDAVAAMRMIRDGKLEPIEKVAPSVPRALAEAVSWGLEPKREQRATSADLAQALEAFIKSSPELATSMQLGGWIRARFNREGTGQEPALNPGTGAHQSPGTQAGPGTMAAPGTAASPGTMAAQQSGHVAASSLPTPLFGGPVPAGAKPIQSGTAPPNAATVGSNEPTQLPVTPPLYPPRRVIKKVTDAPEGTEIYSTSEESAATVKAPRFEGSSLGPSGAPSRPGTRQPLPEPQRRAPTRPPSFVAPANAATVIAPPGHGSDDRTLSTEAPAFGGATSSGEATQFMPGRERDGGFGGGPTNEVTNFVGRGPGDSQPFGDATELVDARHLPAPDEEDSQNVFETVLQDRRTPIPSGPSVVPTLMMHASPGGPVPPSGAHGVIPGSGAHGMPGAQGGSGPYGAQPYGPQTPSGGVRPVGPQTPGGGVRPVGPQTPGGGVRPINAQTLRGTGNNSVLPRKGAPPMSDAQRRAMQMTPDQTALLRRRRLLAIAGLGGLMLLSFLIALLASSSGPRPAVVPDDAIVMTETRIDAALPVAPPPVDAELEPTVPTIPVDAAPAMAYLVVRTIPDGGTIRVGDQTRVATVQPTDPTGSATAQLVLEAGRHTIEAELAGWQPEKRDVILDAGENKTIEITFTKKIQTQRPERGQSMGRLTVRTTPWSDVYLGSKKLGQAPFADLELPVGTHTLTFKNPSRPMVTKTVTIKANKLTKLNFSLP